MFQPAGGSFWEIVTAKLNALNHPLTNKIYCHCCEVNQLVSYIIDLMPPCLKSIRDYMNAYDHANLPIKTKRKEKRQRVQEAVCNQMPPILSFGVCKKINLKKIITNEMTDKKFIQYFHLLTSQTSLH